MKFDKIFSGKILQIIEEQYKKPSTKELFLCSRVEEVTYRDPDMVKYRLYGMRLDTQESHSIFAYFDEKDIYELSVKKKLTKNDPFKTIYSIVD